LPSRFVHVTPVFTEKDGNVTDDTNDKHNKTLEITGVEDHAPQDTQKLCGH